MYEDFKIKFKETRTYIGKKPGNYMFLVFSAIVLLIFLAPLFPANVGTVLISCVAAPYLILIWRKNSRELAVVPAVFLSAAMILSGLIYLIAGNSGVAAYYFIAIICIIICATADFLNFFDKINDNLKLYLTAGAICCSIVIIASLMALIISVAWWIFAILAFLLLLGLFIAVVVGTAAYTATDDTRQERKRKHQRPTREQYYKENMNNYRPVQKVNTSSEIFDADFED